MTSQPVGQQVVEPDPRRWKALAVLALVQFMLVLDITVVNVALPRIKDDLDFSEPGLAWVVNSYVLVAGGFLLLGGRLADIVGRRALFMVGVGIFAVASAVCGAAQNPGMLVGARFVQGLGEAFAGPASMGLIALLFPDNKERMKALGIWGGIAGLGGTTGTVISGVITDLINWRWVFFINLPVAAFALLMVPRLVSESRMVRTSSRPDFAGAITGTAGLVAIVDGLINAATHAWGDWQVLVPLLGGLALLGLMTLIESRSESPLVPLDFFRNRTRVAANLVTLLFAPGFFAYFFLLTLYMQQIHQFSPMRGGLAYLPFGITIGVGIGVGTAVMGKIGVKPVLTVGFVLCATGLFLTSLLEVSSTYPANILPGMMVLAFGSGMSFPAITNAALHLVTGQDSSLASGVQTAMQQIGGALGLSVLATLGFRHATSALGFRSSDCQHPDVLARAGRQCADALTDGYGFAFLVGAIMMLIGAVVVAVFFEHVDATPHVPGAEVGDEPEAVPA